ncbi:hypothetical protein CRI94_06915 [Longibacter salinarum]|uniref:Uracil-DNA glycosylase-like domain-containing protein n=1 Tax=Longibacter salinarum TaxID=1850348 RepID=A0A2A8CYV2_9BACT|nr:uracil-DNA glycosylase [Longibacter salinarum]PEN13794.1 hypothetical protein CRI94_06915 [Longibacter salinarum]
MLLQPVYDLFSHDLFDVLSTDELFNLYGDEVSHLDVDDAAAIRRKNVHAYLSAYEEKPSLFLLAEAPGPWGCRFSGVPITAEAQLVDPEFPIDGVPTSLEEEPHTEYSANIFWRVLQPVFPQFFVWNSVPLHPHNPGEPLSIRNPRRSEVARWESLTKDIIDILQPERVVGIGRKAERAVKEIGVDVTYVRHPSQGGATKFTNGIADIVDELGLPEANRSK